MSTEVKITPYDEGGNRDQGIGLAGDIAKGLTLDEKQKESLARRKEEERKERARLIKPETPELIAVPLKLKNPDTLVQSALTLGFKLQPLEMPKVPAQSQPSIILSRPSGETITLRRGETGRLMIETPRGNVSAVHEVMERRSIDQAINHLKKDCKSVEVKKTLGGGYVVVAQEGNRGQKDGAARITAHISKEGVATVDVSNIKGNRCEKIINGIAKAIGGECVRDRKKNEYFQVPAEQKEKIRV